MTGNGRPLTHVRATLVAWCMLAVPHGEASAQGSSIAPTGFPFPIGSLGAEIGGRPSIAFDGTNFFVAWMGGSSVIAGTRVSPAGTVLDPAGISLGTGLYPPSVAFDGSNFLIVWEYGTEIAGVRVTPAGGVLDSPPLVLTNGADSKTRPTAIAFGDTTYLIAWRNSYDDLYAARITRGGVNLDAPTGVRIGRGFYPWASFDGTNFFVVWHDHGNGLDIYGNRVGQDGVPLDGTGFLVFTGPEDQDHSSVTFDGTNFLVAWHDFRGGADDETNDGTARATRVSTGGVPLDDPAIQVADQVHGQVPVVATFDGTHVLVAWMVAMWPAKARVADAYGRRIGPDGAVIDRLPFALGTAYGHQWAPTIAWGGGSSLVAWRDLGGGRCYDGCLYAQIVAHGPSTPPPDTVPRAPVAAGWQPFASPTSRELHAVWGAADGTAHAVGEEGTFGFDGNTWQLGGGVWRSYGVWGAGPDDVWAVGGCWNFLRYDGQVWNSQGCHGTGQVPELFPTGLGIWGAHDQHILTVGPEGSFQQYDGSNWHGGATGTRSSLWDVWGTSETNAYAVGEYGTMMRFDGASWTRVVNVPTLQSLNDIWGSGPDDIFAVGDFGTVVHFDGTAWTLQSSGTNEHLFGVWGYSSSHVYAVGYRGTILYYDGTSWQPEASGSTTYLLDVGGSGGNLWVVGYDGTILGKSVPGLRLEAAGRADSVPVGALPEPDSVTVSMSGPGASAITWSATHTAAASWLTLTTSAGIGSGVARWSRDPAGLAVGTYVDTITLVADAMGSPARIVDTLFVEPALAVALDPTNRRDSVSLGSTGLVHDSATVALAGFRSSTADWSATHTASASWITLTLGAGTGSGLLRWSRDPTGLALGTHVDTITVTVANAVGSPALLIDTLLVEPALALSVDPSRLDSVWEGATAPFTDSAAVALAGLGSSTAEWSAAHAPGATWITLTTSGGTGTGMLRWSRDPTGLTSGTWVDTLTVSAPGAVGSPAHLVDTLRVVPALALELNPTSRRDSVVEGATEPLPDSADVTLVGFGSSEATWSATHGAPATWVTLTASAGSGSGVLRWSRDPSALTAGTYVDTITVTVSGAMGSPAKVIDTLVIGQALTMVAAPAARHDTTIVGLTGTRVDSAGVTLTGDGAATATWTVAHRAQAEWITLVTSQGTGSGTVTWERQYDGLAEGTYVDSIVIAAAEAVGSPAVVVDTLMVRPPPVTTDAVVNAILGDTELTAEQSEYLDAVGNHNGRFDLGDFLAWVLQHPGEVDASRILVRQPGTPRGR